MLYEDVDFKTISDRYTKRHMLPFLTHIDGVRANLFSINTRQKMAPTMVNQEFVVFGFILFYFFFYFLFFFLFIYFFFHRKIRSNKLFSF